MFPGNRKEIFRKTFGQECRVLCGPGNNGGDGAALAQLLSAAGAITEVILFARVEETHGDARINFDVVHETSNYARQQPGLR